MMSRIARLGVLLMTAVGLVAGSAAPAGAASAGSVAVVGTAAVGNGIAYPCLDGKTTPPSVNPAKCLPNSNTASVSFVSTVAAGAVASTAKPGPAVEAGTFSIVGTGSVTGACGLSSGGLSGSITPILALGTKAKTRTFAVTFQGVGGTLVIMGTTSKGETVEGVVLALPTTGTCLNKTPKAFTIVGPILVAGA